MSQESQGQPRWGGSVQLVSDADRTYDHIYGYFMLQFWDDPPSAASSVPHSSARHGGERRARVVEPLVS